MSINEEEIQSSVDRSVWSVKPFNHISKHPFGYTVVNYKDLLRKSKDLVVIGVIK